MVGARGGFELSKELERLTANDQGGPVTIERKLTGASLLDYSQRTIDLSQTLLGHRWLCPGGGAFVFGPSGVGKSVLTVQGAIQWGCGHAAFGIKPARALRSQNIQRRSQERGWVCPHKASIGGRWQAE
jgi:RecA-family ATPase